MIIYSGNKKITGGLLETNFNIAKNKNDRSELNFFFKIKKQTDYDKGNDRPVFKDGDVKTVKFSRAEIAAMIVVFQSSMSGGPIVKWSGYHQGEKSSVAINFSYFHRKAEGKFNVDTNMFTLQFIVDKDDKYQVGISTGDMYALAKDLELAMDDFSRVEWAETNEDRMKFSKDNQSNKGSNNSSPANDSGDDDEDDDEDGDVPF